jgi:hypothetical protein
LLRRSFFRGARTENSGFLFSIRFGFFLLPASSHASTISARMLEIVGVRLREAGALELSALRS